MVAEIARVALVTGAGTGIGRAASLALAGIGFELVVVGRRAAPLQALAGELAAQGRRALAMPTDVTDVDAVRRLFSRIDQEYGRLDLLFNNAGTAAPVAPLEDVRIEDWRTVLDTNVTGAMLCTQEAFRLMKRQTPRGGRIINNGSISSYTPRPQQIAYTVSKHAITGLTKATALDGRPFDIACGQIDIGNAATSIGSYASAGALQPDGSRKVEPMMELRDVGEAVKLMASLPLSANVLRMTVMATTMPFVGRG